MDNFDNKSHTYTLTYCTRSIYLMSLIFYKHFHIACRPSGAFADLALPKSVASCHPLTSQEFTYVAGFHWFNGGPTIKTNSNEDIVANCQIELNEEVYITFILLNPRSHSAVLIVPVMICCTLISLLSS